jgi:hypothetical protein
MVRREEGCVLPPFIQEKSNSPNGGSATSSGLGPVGVEVGEVGVGVGVEVGVGVDVEVEVDVETGGRRSVVWSRRIRGRLTCPDHHGFGAWGSVFFSLRGAA